MGWRYEETHQLLHNRVWKGLRLQIATILRILKRWEAGFYLRSAPMCWETLIFFKVLSQLNITMRSLVFLICVLERGTKKPSNMPYNWASWGWISRPRDPFPKSKGPR